MKLIRLSDDIANSIDCPSNTAVDNVNVRAGVGFFQVLVNDQVVDVGTVIKAKGTLTQFRHNMQLEMKRVSVVHTTAEEAQSWAQAAEFKENVLSRPWIITVQEQDEFRQQEQRERQKAVERERSRREHRARKEQRLDKHRAKLAQYEEREDRELRKLEKRYNEGALI